MATGDPKTISCAAGPQCAYLRFISQCTYSGYCDFQRPRARREVVYRPIKDLSDTIEIDDGMDD